MERARIIEMLEKGALPSQTTMEELRLLSKKYPWCSTFHVMEAIGSREKDELELTSVLNIASIYTQDRSKLYDLVVKDKLKKRIDHDSSEAEDLKVEPETNTPEQRPEISIVTKPQEHSEDPGEEGVLKNSPISKDPLEDQIMAEAVVHLGEIEMDQKLSELGSENEPEAVTRPETVRPRSFGDWLLRLDSDSNVQKPEREIIDKFINNDPKITPARKAFFSPSQMGKMSLMENETFVSETLAGIYEKQGDFKKAVKAYKNLGLKYPEKRLYFAALQKKAEEKLKNK